MGGLDFTRLHGRAKRKRQLAAAAIDGIDADARCNDTLTVRITLLTRESQSSSAGFGTGSVSMLWKSQNCFSSGAYQLEYLVRETNANNKTHSGVGIDNILVTVTAATFPAAAWLMLGWPQPAAHAVPPRIPAQTPRKQAPGARNHTVTVRDEYWEVCAPALIRPKGT